MECFMEHSCLIPGDACLRDTSHLVRVPSISQVLSRDSRDDDFLLPAFMVPSVVLDNDNFIAIKATESEKLQYILIKTWNQTKKVILIITSWITGEKNISSWYVK